MTAVIKPLQVGSLVEFEKSKFMFGRDFGEKIVAPCICWLIQGNGYTILVDTGPSRPECMSVGHGPMSWEEGESLATRLLEAGVKPSQIDTVVLTHLHWDHCYNGEALTEARFYVQRRELQYAIAPLPVHRLAYEAQLSMVQPAWFRIFDRICPVDGEMNISDDVKLIPLPGHSPGFQGVLVNTKAGPYLIAGDFLPLFENWMSPDPTQFVPTGIHTSLDDCYASFDKVRSITTKFLPGHDPRVLEREVYGED